MTHSHQHGSQPHDHRASGIIGWIAQALHIGGHEHAPLASDSAFNATSDGIRTIWLALLALGVTSLLQIGVVAFSGSVALLADTVHNIGDTLNSIPLLIAFYLARRAATRHFTYGYGRAEDVAGVFIVLSIAVSAAIVFWESFQKLLNPQPMQNIGWVAAAAVIGFLGNEAVALLQIRTGRRIGSEAMVADGLHARIDGLTSLAVLIAAGGTAVGLPILDPIIGLVIGVAILFITRDAARRVWFRLMDGVDPGLIMRIEHFAGEVSGVTGVSGVRARWVGHRLFVELRATVDATLSLTDGDTIASRIETTLGQAIPQFGSISLRIVPDTLSYSLATVKPEITQLENTVAGLNILPARYQLSTPSATPMGAAGLKFDADGRPAWNEIWTDFCDLALAGGPPHRGTLLEPVLPEEAARDPDNYARVLAELERGIRLVTGLDVVTSVTPGWIGMACSNEAMAVWLLRAIVVENISVRREGTTLYFPAGPKFALEREIKNVITVIAKTYHYWQEHIKT
jgi:cation diffusion facilitator family transporter